MDDSDTFDLTSGVYRRIYDGFISGRRINSVSIEAEAWFWRLLVIADDFGNLPGEDVLVYTRTAGRRVGSVTIEDVSGWVRELVSAGLLATYESGKDQYLHVVGFIATQAAGINGRRVRRYPASPMDDAERAVVNPGESKRRRVNPNDKPETRNQKPDPEAQSAARPAGGETPSTSSPASPAASAAAADPIVLVFPVDGNGPGGKWALRESLLAQLAERFPTLDALAECRAALAHVEGNPVNRKTASGMQGYLTRWLTRSQNTPRLRAKPNATAVEQLATPSVDRSAARRARIEQAVNA